MLEEENFAHAERDVKELIFDNWPTVLRIGRHLERHDLLTPDQLLGAISHELCLQYRDIPVVRHVLSLHLSERQRVDLTRLRETVSLHGANNRPQTASKAPPFAIKGDHLINQSQSRTDLEGKKASFRRAFLSLAGENSFLSRSQFFQAMNKLAAYGLSYREAQDLFSVLDPKKTGQVSVQDFCDRFTFEFLKPKSMRQTLGSHGSDGYTTAFEWPGSIRPKSSDTVSSPSRSLPSPPSGTSVRTTKSSQLRKLVADSQKFRIEEHDPQPPIPETHIAAPAALPMSLPARRPAPPSSARIRTRIIADAAMLGNV